MMTGLSAQSMKKPLDTAVALSADVGSRLIPFAACLGILGAALILIPAQPGDPHVRLGPFPLPSLCIFWNLTGLPCPGCGLVRSCVAAVHGDLAASFAFHRLGIPTLALIILQLACSAVWFMAPNARGRLAEGERLLNRTFMVLAALFGLNWIYTLTVLLL